MPAGRPSEYKAQYCETIQSLANVGCTDSQIADLLGVSIPTIYSWREKHPEFLNAIKVVKGKVDDQIENALRKSAAEGSNVAQIFWLKNRRRDEWKDRNTLEGSNDAPLSITFKSILDKE